MIEDKYRWLKQYAKPCFNNKVKSVEELPNIRTIEEFLNGDYSREKVKDYFTTVHNLRTLKDKNYIHLLIPYEIIDINEHCASGVVHEPFFQELPIPLCNISLDNNKIKKARDFGIINNYRIEDIMLVHFLEIVDSCSPEELEKYNYLYATQPILK